MINQLVINDYLTSYGLSVTVVENGLEATSAARKEHFDLIFMDLQMPIMDGYEATRTIRKFDSHVPIVALSAAVMERDREASAAAGMNSHMGKPIDPEELQATLYKYLSGQAHNSANDQDALDGATPTSIDGIDLEAFSKNFSNTALVTKLLTTFVNDYTPTSKKFGAELSAKQLRANVHELKGVAGNMKMNELYTLTAELNANKDDEYLLAKRAELVAQLERMVANIQRYLATT